MSFLHHLLPRKLFWRYMLIFVLIGIFPFVAVTSLTLNQTSDVLREEAETRFSQMIHLAALNLDAQFRSLASITERMYLYRVYDNQSSFNLETLLKSGKNIPSSMSNYLSSLADSSDYLRNVLFIDLINDQVYAVGKPSVKSIRPDWNYKDWSLLQEASLHPRALTISGPHADGYFYYGSQQVFTFCRPMLSLDDLPEKETILGFMLLDIDHSVFSEAFRSYDWQSAGRLYVVNEDQLILYASNSPETGSVLASEHSVPGFTPVEESIPTCQWRILFLINEKSALQPVLQLRNRLLSITGVTLLLMLIITWFSSRRMAMPVRRILKQMEEVRSGHLDVSVPVNGSDEMSDLSRGFNHMTTSLQQHIEQSYVASIRQKEAELDALRMQIHPHFLYNTLEVIRMSSVAHQDPETAQMTLSLVHQLQYVIGDSSEQVPLKKELAIVQDYISLVSLRYGQIELKSGIPAELLDCMILKMTLQPIVENAVQHGLRPLGGGRISISAARRESLLEITVMDNGCGMEPEDLDRLRNQLLADKLPEVKEDGLRSIGTKNVHDRIRLACGPAYGLEIESQPGVGTAVVIHLPWQKAEKDGTL